MAIDALPAAETLASDAKAAVRIMLCADSGMERMLPVTNRGRLRFLASEMRLTAVLTVCSNVIKLSSTDINDV